MLFIVVFYSQGGYYMYGSRIRGLRIKNEYTQEDLADKLDVSPKTIGSWEREERLPPINKLTKIAKMFEVSIDYIVGLKHLSSDATDQDLDDLNRILNQGQLTYREEPVSEEAQEAVRSLLEGYYWRKGRERLRERRKKDGEE